MPKITVKPTGIDNIPPKYNKSFLPQPKAKIVPRNYFAMLACGVTGSGKTFAIVKCISLNEHTPTLNQYGDKMAHRTILFCPTIAGQEIFHSLHSLNFEEDAHEDYTDDKLIEKIADIEAKRKETQEYLEMKRLVKIYNAGGEAKLTEDEMILLASHNFEMPDPPLYPNGVITHIIFDDLVGTSAFKPTGKSALTNFVIKKRHYKCNLYIATQALSNVPRTIRINCQVYCMYKFADVAVLKDLQEIVAGFLTPDVFAMVYKYATQERFNFLTIDTTQEPGQQLLQNFQYYLEVKNAV